MKQTISFAIILFLIFFITGSAAGQGYPWNNNAQPFDFKFGNHIDSHQQSGFSATGDLKGFIYIEYTGEFIDGYPVAEHVDCGTDEHALSCQVGWRFQGRSGRAAFVGREAGDHPIWEVETRNDIPQPGAFSHFHWINGPENAVGLIEGRVYNGYFFQLRAIDAFYFRHGGENGDMALITPGIDIASHVNIVSGFPDDR